MAIAWLLEFGASARLRTVPDVRLLRQRMLGWVHDNPTRLVVIAAVAFLGVNVLSTLTSVSLHQSLWGKLPGGDGYSLYNIVTYFFLFLIIATKLKTRSQVRHLATAVAATGTIVGLHAITQWYGVDPFGLSQPSVRAISSIGNPIFVGAFLVLTIPLTAAVGIAKLFWGPSWFQVLVAITMAIIQLLGLVFTWSRGPWIGLAFSLLVFAGLSLFTVRTISWGRVVAVGVAVALLSTFIFNPSMPSFGQAVQSQVIQPVAARGSTLYEEIQNPSNQARFGLWQSSYNLVVSRPPPTITDRSLRPMRSLLGYGPESFSYVWALATPETFITSLNLRYAYAHNHLVHEAVELGLLGLMAYLGLLITILGTGTTWLIKNRHSPAAEYRWILIVLLSATAGRFVEELVGIAKVSDSTIFWALMGLLVALKPALTDAPVAAPRAARQARTSRSRGEHLQRSRLQLWSLSIVAFVVLGIAVLTWVKNVNYYRAALLGADSVHALNADHGDDALFLAKKAQNLAPDVVDYHLQIAEIYRQASTSFETEDRQARLMAQAYDAARQAQSVDPLSTRTNLVAANIGITLANLGQDFVRQEAFRSFERFAASRPDIFETFEVLASGYLQGGDPAKAKAAAARSFEMQGGRSEAGRAQLLMSIADLKLGNLFEARAFATSALDSNRLTAEETQAATEIIADVNSTIGTWPSNMELAYEDVLRILGPTGVVMPLVDPNSTDPTKFGIRQIDPGAVAVTFTWSKAPTGWDAPFDPVDLANWEGHVPVLTFDGSDDTIVHTSPSRYWSRDDSLGQGFSVGTWVRTERTPAHRTIMSKWNPVSGAREWSFAITTDDKLQLSILDTATVSHSFITSEVTVPQSSWSYIVATYNGAGGASALSSSNAKFYVDGAQVATIFVNNPIYISMASTTSSVALASLASGHDLYMGEMAGGPLGPFFTHKIMTAREVADLYNLADVPAVP